MSKSSLTPAEQAMIDEALARRSSMLKYPEDKNVLPEVTPKEYLSRLAASREKDRKAQKVVQQAKITQSMKEWRAAVGPTFEDADTALDAALDRIHRLESKEGLHKTSMVIYGSEYGRGKTWNAYGFINTLISKGLILPGQVFHGTETSTVSRIANSGFERPEELKAMKHARNKVFFIDDVGQASYFKPEQREEVWYELINHVYANNLTLVITTNKAFNADSLGRWIGGRAFDRLRALVGDDGAILLGGSNRRTTVLQENEKEYQKRRNRDRQF